LLNNECFSYSVFIEFFLFNNIGNNLELIMNLDSESSIRVFSWFNNPDIFWFKVFLEISCIILIRDTI
jgi:hypothetical protein